MPKYLVIISEGYVVEAGSSDRAEDDAFRYRDGYRIEGVTPDLMTTKTTVDFLEGE